MTGAELHQEALRLAGPNGEWYYAPAEDVPSILARAQVLASLAQTAATVEAAYASSVNPMPSHWAAVLRPERKQVTA